MKIAASALFILCALATPALAENYPVSGRWGESDSAAKGAIDCSGRRVIDFKGNQRTDSRGGVPAYRNRSVTEDGQNSYRIVDEFATGQISARTNYGLRKVDNDHIEMNLKPGGTLKLQRCK
ncbi:MAG TPA: hypothetical protein VHD14_17955 [Pseudolabrys sp.]|jgi:hypothetical protein|nr:hypothetical protein [Pseudolabrys sp.]